MRPPTTTGGHLGIINRCDGTQGSVRRRDPFPESETHPSLWKTCNAHCDETTCKEWFVCFPYEKLFHKMIRANKKPAWGWVASQLDDSHPEIFHPSWDFVSHPSRDFPTHPEILCFKSYYHVNKRPKTESVEVGSWSFLKTLGLQTIDIVRFKQIWLKFV